MKGSIPFRIPIESFIVLGEEDYGSRYRLVYFDPKGRRQEAFVKKSIFETALGKLDGSIKSIARSSGGIVPAQPYQMVLYHCMSDSVGTGPELRIKVRFKDFLRNEGEKTTSGGIVTVTKNVLPEEVLDPVKYDIKNNQKFLIDFGQGAIPITVFSFLSEPGGDSVALFVESDAVERSIRERQGSRVLTHRYRVPRDVIRVVRDTHSGEFEAAKANYERIKKLRQTVVPTALQTGPTVDIPTGFSFQAVGEFLRRSMHRWNREDDDQHTAAGSELRDDGCVTSDFLMYMEPA